MRLVRPPSGTSVYMATTSCPCTSLTCVFAGKQKKIVFEFDVQEDNPAEVAKELVEQLIESQPPEKKPNNLEDLQAFTSSLTAHFTEHIENAGTT